MTISAVSAQAYVVLTSIVAQRCREPLISVFSPLFCPFSLQLLRQDGFVQHRGPSEVTSRDDRQPSIVIIDFAAANLAWLERRAGSRQVVDLEYLWTDSNQTSELAVTILSCYRPGADTEDSLETRP